ncbi:MAG TPA: hypothetical protein VLC95_11780, partial [Anaerolineae bacterium]|nr:hypothetical protein [Anaerolineae bacterium]
VPQMLLAGAFIPLADMDPVTRFLSALIPARWTFETLGAQIDVLGIFQQQGGDSLKTYRGFFETFHVDATGHLLIMLAGLLILLAASYIALRRHDPL